MHDYDRTSKWLIQHHGDSLLRIAGVRDLVAWRPLQAEVVQLRQLPDGLIEPRLAGDPEPRLFVLELATYPDRPVLTRLRYNDPRLVSILGGTETMLELPFLDELIAVRVHKYILNCLRARFGSVPADVEDALRPIEEDAKLNELVVWAATCPDIASFRSRLSPES